MDEFDRRWNRIHEQLLYQLHGDEHPRIASRRTLFGIKSEVEKKMERFADEIEQERQARVKGGRASGGEASSDSGTGDDGRPNAEGGSGQVAGSRRLASVEGGASSDPGCESSDPALIEAPDIDGEDS